MLRLSFSRLALLTFLICAPLPACSQATPAPGDETPALYQQAIKSSRTLIEQRIAEGVPGFSVAVAVDGATVWAEGFGVADLDTGAPVTTETRFRIGSTSKPITSVLAGRLLDRGQIDLDADIRDLLPEFPEKRYTLTLRDLLSMQGGIRHYRGRESLNEQHYASIADGLAIFQEDSLLFEPNTDVVYSSYSFNLAGAVLARAVGRSYSEAISADILEPLEMTSTVVDDPTVEIPQRASFYSFWNNELVDAPPVDDSYKAPSGGLLSTPSDMVRFGSALISRQTPDGTPWLSAQTLQELVTRRQLADGRTTDYALGFRVQEPDAETGIRYAIHHGGSAIGGRSMLLIYPNEGVVVSLLSNYDGYNDKEDDARSIAEAFVASLGR